MNQCIALRRLWTIKICKQFRPSRLAILCTTLELTFNRSLKHLRPTDFLYVCVNRFTMNMCKHGIWYKKFISANHSQMDIRFIWLWSRILQKNYDCLVLMCSKSDCMFNNDLTYMYLRRQIIYWSVLFAILMGRDTSHYQYSAWSSFSVWFW